MKNVTKSKKVVNAKTVDKEKKVAYGKYFPSLWADFKKSWSSLDVKLILVMFYEVLFYTSFIFLTGILAQFFEKRITALMASADIASLDLVDTVATSQATEVYAQVLILIVLLPITLFLIGYLTYSVTRYLVWATVYMKRMNWKSFGKFMGTISLWAVIWMIPILIEFLPFVFASQSARTAGIQVESLSQLPMAPLLVVMLVLMAVTVYLFAFMSVILFKRFFEEGKILSSISFALGKGFTKIHYYLIPVAIIYVILQVSDKLISKVLELLSMNPGGASWIVQAVIMAFFLAWSKFFLAKVTDSYV